MRVLIWVVVMLGVALPVSSSAQRVIPDTITVASGTLQLKGLLWRPRSTVAVPAVLFHGGGGCDDIGEASRALASRFAARGYAFLWLSRRGAGASRGQGECAFEQIDRARAEQGNEAALDVQLRLMTTTELADALAALDALRSIPGIDTRRIAVAGGSYGGQLALLTGERDKGVRAVLNFSGGAAVWGGSAKLRARLLEAMAGISAPVFLGYAEDDNAEPGRILGAELRRLGKVHELAIYPSGGHNFVFSATHPSNEDVFRFISIHLRD